MLVVNSPTFFWVQLFSIIHIVWIYLIPQILTVFWHKPWMDIWNDLLVIEWVQFWSWLTVNCTSRDIGWVKMRKQAQTDTETYSQWIRDRVPTWVPYLPEEKTSKTSNIYTKNNHSGEFKIKVVTQLHFNKWRASIPLFLVCSLTHSVAKNVDYGTHEKRAHPVESNGSITVPVQNMTHNYCDPKKHISLEKKTTTIDDKDFLPPSNCCYHEQVH